MSIAYFEGVYATIEVHRTKHMRLIYFILGPIKFFHIISLRTQFSEKHY